jgi:hypothetical protein
VKVALLSSLSSSSFFLTNVTCGQTNKQKKQEKKKVRCLLGSRSCSRVGPALASTALLFEAPLQAPAPSSVSFDVSGTLAME